MKICKTCGESKPLSEFHKNKTKQDGLNIYCKQCVKNRRNQYIKNGRCPRCGSVVKNKTKKTCENCRNIWGYDFELVKLENVPSKSGNYILYFSSSKSVYIGASCNLRDRLNGHIKSLKNKTHKNKTLQKYFDLLEHPNYILIGINLCNERDIYENECKIWRILDEKGFNVLNQQKPKLKIFKLSQSRIKTIYSKIKKQENGCWYYENKPHKDGYCYVRIGGQHIAIHRVIYTLEQRQKLNNASWEIPKRLLLRHTCHNKRCCNPAHLILGTDKENRADSRNCFRKPPIRGQIYEAWGEVKKSGVWMKDKRKHPDLCFSTFNARIKKLKWSVEDALTKPPFKKEIDEEQQKNRKNARIQRLLKQKQQFETASLIRKLYKEGEHIVDLSEYFNQTISQINSIINKKRWYNPSYKHKNLGGYIRKRRRGCESDTKKYIGVSFNKDMFFGYAYINSKCVACGKFVEARDAAKAVNDAYISYNQEPPNKLD